MSERILTFDDSARDNTFREFINGWTRMNEDFAAYLDGKSVAIVGRANLEGLEQGDKIDSYDVVVRMHYPLPYVPKDSSYFPVEHEYKGFNFNYPKHWKKRIGARTDIFYLSDLEDDSVALAAKDLDNMKPIRYACCEPDCSMFLASQLAEQRFVRFITYGHVSCCANLLGSVPLKGTSIICDILKHRVEKVYLTGFPCWITPAGRISEGYDPNGMPGSKPWNDFNFLKKLSYHERVEIDPLMQEQFSKFGVYVDRTEWEHRAVRTTPHSQNVDY